MRVGNNHDDVLTMATASQTYGSANGLEQSPKSTPTNGTYHHHHQKEAILFNTTMFDAPPPSSDSYMRENSHQRPHDIAIDRHYHTTTAPVTPPFYSPVHQTASFHQMQTPTSSSVSTGTVQGQSRSMSIQSIVSIGTQDTRESSINDDAESFRGGYEGSDAGSIIGVGGVEDDDVRLAALALGDLRADFASPRHVLSPPPEERPLINLIGGVHPYVGTAMKLSRSAYRGSKNYSPRFKYGAEIVERAAGPVSNVVSFAARSTGVESLVRRNLEARQPETIPEATTTGTQTPAKTKKRRKTAKPGSDSNMAMDVDDPDPDTDVDLTHKGGNELVPTNKPTDENWQRRLILQTAGMGAALSEESLKSLKYCFDWLRWANTHLDQVIVALKSVLDEWDTHTVQRFSSSSSPTTTTNGSTSTDLIPSEQHRLQARIDELKSDVVATLKRVVDIVSTYAGGALPQNARLYVKQCLTSLPQRWARVAAAPAEQPTSTALTISRMQQPAAVTAQGDTNRKVLLLAKEGLDMLHQVSSIVEGTLVRAEEWCDRLGRRRPSAGEFGEVGWEEGQGQGVTGLLKAAEAQEVKDR